MANDSLRDLFNDWMDSHRGESETPPILAATVILLRDRDDGLEVLMMRRNSSIAFGGAWVFPGGKLDPEDWPADDADDVLTASRNAASREADEEGSITVDPDALVPFSHWMPPAIVEKRFATWFFVGRTPTDEVTIDDGEITAHAWMRPADALAKHVEREVELAPPTWMTLNQLSSWATVDDVLAAASERTVPFYVTRVRKVGDDPCAMWHGDDAYDGGDVETAERRHRLVMQRGGWRFEHS